MGGKYVPLFITIEQNKQETFKWLINSTQIDINAADVSGHTALMGAFISNRTTYIYILLGDNRIGFNEKNNNKYTTLQLVAAYSDNPDYIEKLLIKGAKIDDKIKKGLTALHFAILKQHEGMVEKLLKFSAAIFAEQYGEHSHLFYALRKGNLRIFQLIIEKYSISVLFNDVTTFIEKSNLFFYIKLYQMSFSLLDLAILFATEEVVDYLLENNANPNSGKHNHTIPSLYLAILNADLELVKKLQRNGADINARYFLSNTPLLIASEIAFNSAVKSFLGLNQTDLEARNVRGENALHIACRKKTSLCLLTI